MRRIDLEEELAAYFSGQLEGAMGLRSWLGGWIESGFMPSGYTGGTPAEPGAQALRAARAAEHIEGALQLAGRHHGLVLAFRFAPRPAAAILPSYGPLTGILLAPVLEDDIRAVVAEEDEQELRRALRSGSAEVARSALELVRPARVWDLLVTLESVQGVLRADAVRRRRTRARLKALAGRALDAAVDAYETARPTAMRRMRDARVQRHARSLG